MTSYCVLLTRAIRRIEDLKFKICLVLSPKHDLYMQLLSV